MTLYAGDVPTPAAINGLDRHQIALLGGDQQFVSTTTLANLSGLTATILANTNYIAEVVLFYNAVNTGDLKLGYTLPAGASWVYSPMSIPSADTTMGAIYTGVLSTSGLAVGAGLGTGQNLIMLIKGTIFGGSVDGTFQMQGAQGTSNGTATTVLSGSYTHLIKV